MAKTNLKAYEEKLSLYEKLVATHPSIERKGATMPYTSMNGNMFTFLSKSGTVALRLPEVEREKFLKKYKSKLSEQYGTVMKEYVDVPEALLKKTRELKKYFDMSVTYAESLKPKPTNKKAKKAQLENSTFKITNCEIFVKTWLRVFRCGL